MSLNQIKAMKSEKGFTIVELLIVVVIIGILAAIVIVAYNGVTNRAKASKANSLATTVQKKAEAYNAELGYYPAALTDLTSAASSTTYYISTNDVSATSGVAVAPTANNGETTVQYAPCPAAGTPKTGVQISYFDFEAGSGTKTVTAGSC